MVILQFLALQMMIYNSPVWNIPHKNCTTVKLTFNLFGDLIKFWWWTRFYIRVYLLFNPNCTIVKWNFLPYSIRKIQFQRKISNLLKQKKNIFKKMNIFLTKLNNYGRERKISWEKLNHLFSRKTSM